MSKPLTAVYPGTFDPMTLGHQDLMRRGSALFPRLILAVAAGHHKRTMFSVEERLDIAKELAERGLELYRHSRAGAVHAHLIRKT